MLSINSGGNKRRPRPIGTPQGQHTLITLLICAILGMVLSRVLPPILLKLRPAMTAVEAQDLGVILALGISGVVMVVRLLKPPKKKKGTSLRERFLKEQEKSDGS